MMRLTAVHRWPEFANAPRDGKRRRLVEIGVGEDDAAGRCRRARARRGGSPSRAAIGLPTATPPVKEMTSTAGVGEERVEDRRRVAAQDPWAARRAARRRQHLRQRERAQRRLLGGLEDDRRAGGDRRGDLVGDLVERVVERRDRRDQADRDAQSVGAAVAPERGDVAGERLAVVAQRLDGGEAEHVDGAAHLVPGVLQAQAGLERDQRGPDPRIARERLGDGEENAVSARGG